jgi:hypothetical protein
MLRAVALKTVTETVLADETHACITIRPELSAADQPRATLGVFVVVAPVTVIV